MTNENRRHSVASEAPLIADDIARAEAEAKNGLLQYDYACHAIIDAIEKGSGWRLRPSLLLGLHREALQGISPYAGNFRPAAVMIEGSLHKPVDAHRVPELIEDLCDYINDNWQEKTAIHLASYAMWRLNWIHPFSDGNGRTSRMISYVVLCIKLGLLLPGRKTIPDQIVENRIPYFDALEQADRNPMNGPYDLSAMENLLGDMLAVQLTGVLEAATGKPLL
jgi:Fic family protein